MEACFAPTLARAVETIGPELPGKFKQLGRSRIELAWTCWPPTPSFRSADTAPLSTCRHASNRAVVH